MLKVEGTNHRSLEDAADAQLTVHQTDEYLCQVCTADLEAEFCELISEKNKLLFR